MTAKELEDKERAEQEELQRMDTDARLQVGWVVGQKGGCRGGGTT